MSEKLPYPESAARQWPRGKVPDRRKIISCSDSKLWYMGMVGEIITVHYFVTFGAWDTKGRWLWYYDLSGPVDRVTQAPEKDNPLPKKENWLKKLFK